LYQHLLQRGFEVQLINPLITSARRNIGIGGSRTDGIISLLIAKYLREIDIKKSALPEAQFAELRTLTRLRYEFACQSQSGADGLKSGRGFQKGGEAFFRPQSVQPHFANVGSHVGGAPEPDFKPNRKEGKARMSKRGSKYLRTALMEAATVAVNCAKDPMFRAIYEKQMEKNKSHLVAVSYVANKMCHVINAVLKNQEPYKPVLA
jgi:transposase